MSLVASRHRRLLSAVPLNRRGLLVGSAAAVAFLAGGAAGASSKGARSAGARIDIAGRQRMLTQRMAQAACFARLRIDAPAHMEILASAHDVFAETQIALRDGDAALDLPPEADGQALKRLSEVDALWEGYSSAVRGALRRGEVDDRRLREIARINLALLAAADRVVARLEAIHGDAEIPLGLAIAINIAGRQRMLSQKMAKECSLIALGVDVEAHRTALRGAVQTFDLSLTALQDGLPTVSIIPPPSAAIAGKLDEVRSLWGPFRAPVERVAEAEVPADADLAAVAAGNGPLLFAMNEAVGLYAEIGAGT